ncbi:hypothetical protein RND71_012608 [Anisodus tanguticus]|uniref:Uncharacterized protein n=1 Tax=Anisodus tanguticus TaxID=243964 RepID=A0AAE1VLX2_9SOLA|nr:hypothetical protein RND71_012608 [Anisodus tanguticus]
MSSGSIPHLGVIPCYAKDESEMRWFDVPGFNIIHAINVWEEDGGDTLVMVAPNILSVEHTLERVDMIHSCVEKVKIDLKTGIVSRHPISTRNLDLAVINPAYVGKKNNEGFIDTANQSGDLRDMDFLSLSYCRDECGHTQRTIASARRLSSQILAAVRDSLNLRSRAQEQRMVEYFDFQIDDSIDYVRTCSHSRGPYAKGVRDNKISIAEADRRDCIVACRKFGEGCFCGEPFFVAKDPNNPEADEDDGYVVSYVHNEKTGESRILVMDAKSPNLDIVAAVKLPGRVPYGFHGLLVRESDLNKL